MAVPKKALIEALTASHGIYALAGDMLGITGQAVGARVKRDADLQALCENLLGKINDKAKSNVVKAIANGDLKQSNWWLERRDKDFTPRQQLTGKDGAPLFDPDTVLKGLTDEELAAVISIRRRAREAGPSGS